MHKPMVSMIDIQDLSHDYAGEAALKNVSLQVSSGILFGMIGADGAGKSTLFKILASLQQAKSGTVMVLGHHVSTDHAYIRSEVGYMPQRFSLYTDMTVLENLKFSAEIMDIPKKLVNTRIDELITFSRLETAKHRRAGNLSGGMKQKLALCCAMIKNPSLMLLDEPTVGVDPVTRRDFWEMLFKLKAEGTTIIVSTPYMDEADLCDEVMLLHQGKMIGRGKPSDLCQSLPGKLWKITGSGTMHVTAHQLPPEPLMALYTKGGYLQAIAPAEMLESDVLAVIKEQHANANGISEVAPQIEDFLLQALRTAEHAHE